MDLLLYFTLIREGKKRWSFTYPDKVKEVITSAGLSDGESGLWRYLLFWEALWKCGGLKLHNSYSSDVIWTAEKVSFSDRGNKLEF